MNRFLTQPQFTTLAGVKLGDKPFVLTAALVYRTDAIEGQHQVFMPEGFRSDLASIPRFFRRIFSTSGWWRDAAWPHDALCSPCNENLEPIPFYCDYKEATNVFLEALNDTVAQMSLTPKQYKRKRRTARFLAWAVKTGGPKFQRGDFPTLKEQTPRKA